MANVTCVRLLAKHHHGDLNIRATWIFSKNDVIANLGVLIAGGLVTYLETPLPDYLIASLISIIIVRGGVQIVTEAHLTLKFK
jgi:Co/Zn/Cd efflux system component